MTWSKQLAQKLRGELSSGACAVIDVLADHPGHQFTTAELVVELSLPTKHSLWAYLGKTTEAAKRIGVAQDAPHSWFVLWENQPEWRYWLDEERAEWWTTEIVWSVEDLEENSRKAKFEAEVRSFQRKKSFQKPQGSRNPKSRSGKSTSYERDPAVVAWVLNLANGICESCGGEAPFLTGDDKPFLEVHHVRRLADNGSDTVENAVAACPNCHRALHHAANRLERTQSLYEKVNRLRKE